MDFFKPKPVSNPEKSTASPLVLNEAEACAAVLLACVRANEIDDGSENAVYAGTIRNRNIFIGYDPRLLTDIVTALYEQLGSPEALVDAAADMIREQTRLPLFYHCLDVDSCVHWGACPATRIHRQSGSVNFIKNYVRHTHIFFNNSVRHTQSNF